ncbi:hypothetical protein PG994_000180 [Apiospora phragmitis]|uniref:Uncharacterized protein n=1 Tax=Apiospora phragmitis TaxID=2905665 RepID=A0ABR1X5G4_9PEZI
MDIKCALENYKAVTGKKIDPRVLEDSIELIKASGVPYEFRMTVVPSLVDVEDLFEAKRLAGGKLKLQQFRKGETNLARRYRDLEQHTDKEFNALVAQLA